MKEFIMVDISKRPQNDGSNVEIVVALKAISQNNPNWTTKVADEKQLMIDADAEVTDEDDDVSEILSLSDGDSEVSYHDHELAKQLNDGDDDDVDAEVSYRDVLETQLNDADAKFGDNVTAAPEKDYFSKVDKILRQMDFSLSKNAPRFRLGSMEYAYLAYRWYTVPIVATTNAMLISLLEYLVAAGGFLAISFTVLISIYFAALPVIVFLISANIVVFIARDFPIVLWHWLVKTSAHASNRFVGRIHHSS